MGENDTLFMDREPQKTILLPYPAAHTYIAHIGEYPLPPRELNRPYQLTYALSKNNFSELNVNQT